MLQNLVESETVLLFFTLLCRYFFDQSAKSAYSLTTQFTFNEILYMMYNSVCMHDFSKFLPSGTCSSRENAKSGLLKDE